MWNRRAGLACGAGLLAGPLTGCGFAGGRTQSVEKWLRARPWVPSVGRVSEFTGPVPIPSKAPVSAEVTARPGIDRAGLDRVVQELGEFRRQPPFGRLADGQSRLRRQPGAPQQ